MTNVNLCESGKVLFVGLMPPAPGGSSIVARNLLSCFSRDSVVVATAGNRDALGMTFEPLNEQYEVLRKFGHSRWLNNQLFRIQVPVAASKVARIAKKIDAKVIIGSHPTHHLLDIARRAAAQAKVPWLAYLHDTLAEATSHLPDAERLNMLQQGVFSEASHVMVMSEGMADLYREKYSGMETTPLEHIYPLEVRPDLPDAPTVPKLFWSGNVYQINAHSFGRAAAALREARIRMGMTSAKSLGILQGMGIDTSGIDRVYYPEWSDYHAALNDHEMHLLALDWPDESALHRDELATIFPTKTPEYLASGRPILVHCPEDYFLARFFRENDCGTLVTERSPTAVAAAIREIRQGGPEIERKARNGLVALDRFAPGRLSSRLKSVVDATAGLRWGEKLNPELTTA